MNVRPLGEGEEKGPVSGRALATWQLAETLGETSQERQPQPWLWWGWLGDPKRAAPPLKMVSMPGLPKAFPYSMVLGAEEQRRTATQREQPQDLGAMGGSREWMQLTLTLMQKWMEDKSPSPEHLKKGDTHLLLCWAHGTPQVAASRVSHTQLCWIVSGHSQNF